MTLDDLLRQCRAMARADRRRWLVFLWILRPLIIANYWLRGKGLLRDKWFWADRVAFCWGFTVGEGGKPERWRDLLH